MSIDTLASIIGTITIVIATGIAIWQLREAARARSLDGFVALSEELKRDAGARRLIYSELVKLPTMTDKEKKKFLSQLTDEQKRQIESVCVTFDRMGVLVMHRLLPKDVAFSMYFDVVLRTWHLVMPFVQEERVRRKNDLLMMYFEELNTECWKYWLKQIKKHREWKYLKDPQEIFRYI